MFAPSPTPLVFAYVTHITQLAYLQIFLLYCINHVYLPHKALEIVFPHKFAQVCDDDDDTRHLCDNALLAYVRRLAFACATLYYLHKAIRGHAKGAKANYLSS